MINSQKVIAIIPARKNSKRLPGKNIKNFCGKPLLSWTIEPALESKYIDKVILTSDDQKAIKIAIDQGCEVPFIRPDYLSTDNATSLDVIKHAVNFFKNQYQYVILLQPTSPLRKTEDIDNALELIEYEKKQVCISVCNLNKPLSWYYFYEEKNGLESINIHSPHNKLICYPNGAIYIFKIDCMDNNTDYPVKSTIPYFMPFNKSIDIDHQDDWVLAEFFKKVEGIVT